MSILAGRKQNLQLSEAGLVGPALATFIAALAVRYRLSRAKIAELLVTWFGVRLSAGTIDGAPHEGEQPLVISASRSNPLAVPSFAKAGFVFRRLSIKR